MMPGAKLWTFPGRWAVRWAGCGSASAIGVTHNLLNPEQG